jgi:hypothetical protein
MEVESEREKLMARRVHLESRLQDIIGPPLPAEANAPFEKTETHWDHVMKELVSVYSVIGG